MNHALICSTHFKVCFCWQTNISIQANAVRLKKLFSNEQTFFLFLATKSKSQKLIKCMSSQYYLGWMNCRLHAEKKNKETFSSSSSLLLIKLAPWKFDLIRSSGFGRFPKVKIKIQNFCINLINNSNNVCFRINRLMYARVHFTKNPINK